MLSLDAYLLQEVEVQKMDEELGKEVLSLYLLCWYKSTNADVLLSR